MATVVQPRRVLIVGDGDLSYSLALQRAFGSVIELTATVLPSAQELVATYANAAANAAELEGCGAAVRYGVDATALTSAELPTGGAASGLYDDVVFNYPHLGDSGLADEAAHARRHSVLIAHFLHEAAALLRPGGRAHLTLSGKQRTTWSVEAAAVRHGLTLAQAREPTAPAAFWLEREPPHHVAAPPRPEWAARRKYRSGTLGTVHWLTRRGHHVALPHGATLWRYPMALPLSTPLGYRGGVYVTCACGTRMCLCTLHQLGTRGYTQRPIPCACMHADMPRVAAGTATSTGGVRGTRTCMCTHRQRSSSQRPRRRRRRRRRQWQ